MNKKSTNTGFTLIELMIVVVIIGLLAMMAIPRFMAVSTKNKQSEAKLILKQIYINQRAYRQSNDTYFLPAGAASAGDPLAFRDLTIEVGPTARYTYTINGDANSFTATATSSILDDDPIQDVWQIDDSGNLVCLSDDARL
jgi:prepilin-type N-terminal cleavage/methylation domain-containing protein